MDAAARYERLCEVFSKVWEAPPECREALIRELCSDDAELAREVRSLVEGTHDATRFLERPAVDRTVIAGVMAGVGSASPRIDDTGLDHALAQAAGAAASLEGRRVGGFVILRLIAEGGIGRVYEAEQESPRRTVALKVLKSGYLTGDALKRFRFEANALASLDHPGIARIHTAGVLQSDEGGAPFIAMELVRDAQSITAFTESRGLDLRARVELVMQACHAVEHAHSAGVIHRDLKPSNILVDPNGRVKVIDFGVAKPTDATAWGRSIQTMTGETIGTPRYMAPEQCGGGARGISTRTDVYALGVVLYELLTGRLPYDFGSGSLIEVLDAVRGHTPVRPTSVLRSLDPDLEAIVLHAIEKDPTARFPSALAMAEDLSRWLNGEPVRSRRPSAWKQAKAYARRHPVATASAALVLVSLGVIALVSTTTLGIVAAKTLELARTNEALRAEKESRTLAEYRIRTAAAAAAVANKDGPAAQSALAGLPRDYRPWEVRHLFGRADLASETLRFAPTGQHHPALLGVAESPDGSMIVITTAPLAEGRSTPTRGGTEASSADPLASTDDLPLRRWTVHFHRVRDGRHEPPSWELAVESESELVPPTGVGLLVSGPQGRRLVPLGVAVPPDPLRPSVGNQKLLLIDPGDGPGQARIVDSIGLHLLPGSRMTGFRVAPSGRRMALYIVPDEYYLNRRLARLQFLEGNDLGEWRLRHDLQIEGAQADSAWDPTSRWFACVESSITVRLIDSDSDDPLGSSRTFESHGYHCHALAFNHDGTMLATGAADGSIRIWDLREWQSDPERRTHPQRIVSWFTGGAAIWDIAWEPHRHGWIVISLADGRIELLDLQRRRGVRWIPEARSKPAGETPDPVMVVRGRLVGHSRESNLLLPGNNRWLVSHSRHDGTTRIWGLGPIQDVLELPYAVSNAWSNAISPSQQVVYISGAGSYLTAWDPRRPAAPIFRRVLPGKAILCLRVLSRQQLLLVGHDNGRVSFWDIQCERSPRFVGSSQFFRSDLAINAIAHTETGSTIAVAALRWDDGSSDAAPAGLMTARVEREGDGSVRIVDSAPLDSFIEGREALALAISPDGGALAVGLAGSGDLQAQSDVAEFPPNGPSHSSCGLMLLKLADRSRHQVGIGPDGRTKVSSLHFTDDGAQLVVGRFDGVISVLETASLRPGPEASARSGSFEASGGSSVSVEPLFHLEGHGGRINGLAMIEDRLLSAGRDGTLRVWDLARRAEVASLTSDRFSLGAITRGIARGAADNANRNASADRASPACWFVLGQHGTMGTGNVARVWEADLDPALRSARASWVGGCITAWTELHMALEQARETDTELRTSGGPGDSTTSASHWDEMNAMTVLDSILPRWFNAQEIDDARVQVAHQISRFFALPGSEPLDFESDRDERSMRWIEQLDPHHPLPKIYRVGRRLNAWKAAASHDQPAQRAESARAALELLDELARMDWSASAGPTRYELLLRAEALRQLDADPSLIAELQRRARDALEISDLARALEKIPGLESIRASGVDS